MPNVDPAAVLPQPPPTVPLWAKVLWYLAGTVGTGILVNAYDYAAQFISAADDSVDPLEGTWRRFTFRATDTISLDPADDQYFSIDIANLTNGNIDGTWTQGDYDLVLGQLTLLAAGWAQFMPTRLNLDQIQAYVKAFNPYSVAKPFADSGPPEYVFSMSHPGTAAGSGPPQGCTTITEQTPSRANWGRFYSPNIASSSYDPSGRVGQANLTAMVTGVHDVYEALMGLQYFPVVPTTSSGTKKSDPSAGGPVRTLQAVTAVGIDDVADIIRRRRHENPLVRIVMPLPAAQQQPASSAT